MSYDATDDDDAPIIAATFVDRESAHDALTELHRAGFRRVWLGVTRADTPHGDRPTIEPEEAGSFMEALGRFFSGEEARGHALYEALVMHGLSEAQARRIDATISPGNAVIVADGEYDPTQAMRIIRTCGGELESNSTSLPETPEAAIADTQRPELRAEALAVEKSRVRSGEARVGKEAEMEHQSLDVPVFHEELYFERRPERAATGDSRAKAIGASEDRVPPTAERADVSKQAVVTEGVAIGKRRIEDTGNASDTVRREARPIDESTADSVRVPDDAPLADR